MVRGEAKQGRAASVRLAAVVLSAPLDRSNPIALFHSAAMTSRMLPTHPRFLRNRRQLCMAAAPYGNRSAIDPRCTVGVVDASQLLPFQPLAMLQKMRDYSHPQWFAVAISWRCSPSNDTGQRPSPVRPGGRRTSLAGPILGATASEGHNSKEVRIAQAVPDTR